MRRKKLDLAKLPFQGRLPLMSIMLRFSAFVFLLSLTNSITPQSSGSFSTAQAAVVRVSLTADVGAMATTLQVSRSVRQNASAQEGGMVLMFMMIFIITMMI